MPAPKLRTRHSIGLNEHFERGWKRRQAYFYWAYPMFQLGYERPCCDVRDKSA
jgi:hypothetical protein